MSTSPTPSTATAPAATQRAPLPLLALVGLLLLRTVLLLAGNAALAPVLGGYHRALPWSNVTIVVVDVITLVVCATVLHRRGQTLRGVLGARLRDTGWAVLCTLILLVAFFAATYIGNLVAYQGRPPMPAAMHPPLWVGIWAITLMPVTIALAEEVLYRGVAMPALDARIGRLGSLLVVSTFFALQHVALTPLEPRAQIARLVTTFLAGLVLGALYRWRGLWPVVVAHWFLDVLGLGLPLLLAALEIA